MYRGEAAMLEISVVHPAESLPDWMRFSNGAIVTAVGQIAPGQTMKFNSAADGDTSQIVIRVQGFGAEPDLQCVAIAAFKLSHANFTVVLTDEHGRRFEEIRRPIEQQPETVAA
jgi:hypothetical protein